MAEHIHGLETEELFRRGIDDLDPRPPDLALSQMQRCHKNNHVAVLCSQPVVGRGRAVAEVIGCGDMAGES